MTIYQAQRRRIGRHRAPTRWELFIDRVRMWIAA